MASCRENPADRPENELATLAIAMSLHDPDFYTIVFGSETITYRFSCFYENTPFCSNFYSNGISPVKKENVCASGSGVVLDGKCPAEDSIGMCNHSWEDGREENVYYDGYKENDLEAIREGCESYGVFYESYNP